MAAKPDRPYSTVGGAYPTLAGGVAFRPVGMQPALDGVLYWQLDNPKCTFDQNMLCLPGE
jgi:hypothetical protein